MKPRVYTDEPIWTKPWCFQLRALGRRQGGFQSPSSRRLKSVNGLEWASKASTNDFENWRLMAYSARLWKAHLVSGGSRIVGRNS